MNKHQYRAVATAFLALVASFALWTQAIGKVALPPFRESTITLVDEIINDLFAELFEVPEVTVENLGNHFVQTVQKSEIAIQASVAPTPTPTPIPTHSAAPLPPPPPSELEQWELMRAWNIFIPSLSVRAPVLLPSMKYWSSQAWDMLEEQMQIGLNHGTVAYPHSVSPGQMGSLIIAGHSSPPDEQAQESLYGSVFAHLPEIAVGEEIQVQSAGTAIRYKVVEKNIVSPKATTILEQQHDESILKLITCYPVGTTRDRMIITAQRIDD
ncbi:MAG: sortase [Candidatus Peregrinibacteria bacterium]|nr:sortase [Candidatus Peregrinibacteria bacterium]MCB9808544.1 sortase [Candidatus Peribacteria bacterium]